MKYQSPIAVIIESKVEGNKLKTVLRLDEVSSPPLAPGGLWNIDKPGQLVIELHKVIHRQENRITFETYDIAENPLRPGDKYNFTSWWAPDQLEIAQSDPTK
jgi:hypothetical protein